VVVFGMKKGKGSIQGNVQHVSVFVLKHGKCDSISSMGREAAALTTHKSALWKV
jgi:hypothetical protein